VITLRPRRVAAIWGFITKYLNAVASPGFDFVPLLLGAVLLWDFFARVMQGVTMAFFEDVWSRNFLNVFATPITTGEYVSGLVLSSVFTSTIGLAVMVVMAAAAFGLSFVGYGVAIVPALLILFLFGIALGTWPALGWGALLAVSAIVLASWVFARVFRHAIRTGLVARYSAETVS